MIELNIPGRGTLQLAHLVSDVNGTLAVDGQLMDGMPRSLRSLRDRLEVHLLTADTHGKQAVIDQVLGLSVTEACLFFAGRPEITRHAGSQQTNRKHGGHRRQDSDSHDHLLI